MTLGVRASSRDGSEIEGDTTVLTLSAGVRGGSLDEGKEKFVMSNKYSFNIARGHTDAQLPVKNLALNNKN